MGRPAGVSYPKCRGESMPNAKLTEAIVREIRHLQRTFGLGYTSIHELLNERGQAVSLSGVRNVVRGETWRHVT